MSPERTATEAAELLPFLIANWPDMKRTRLKQWLKFSSVRVNGKAATRHDHPLKPGDKVSIKVERAPVRRPPRCRQAWRSCMRTMPSSSSTRGPDG